MFNIQIHLLALNFAIGGIKLVQDARQPTADRNEKHNIVSALRLPSLSDNTVCCV